MSSEISKQIVAEKKAIQNVIQPLIDAATLNKNQLKRQKTELIDFGKFVVTSGLPIEILQAPYTIPDLLIKWNDELFAVEHTAVIDSIKKAKSEKTDYLVRQAEKYFLKQFGSLPFQVRFSLKFEISEINPKQKSKLLKPLLENYGDLGWSDEKLMANAHPGFFTLDDINRVAKELAVNANEAIMNRTDIETDYLYHLSILPSQNLLFTRSIGWSADSIEEPVLAAMHDKEQHIDQYNINSNGLKQLLFLVVHGSNGYSDYAFFDPTNFRKRNTPFSKVILFNFFTCEYFILK